MKAFWFFCAFCIWGQGVFAQQSPSVVAVDTFWSEDHQVGIVPIVNRPAVYGYPNRYRMIVNMSDPMFNPSVISSGLNVEQDPYDRYVVRIIPFEENAKLIIRTIRNGELQVFGTIPFQAINPPVPQIQLVNSTDTIVLKSDSLYHLNASSISGYKFVVKSDTAFLSQYPEYRERWVFDSLTICKFEQTGNYQGTVPIQADTSFPNFQYSIGDTFSFQIGLYNREFAVSEMHRNLVSRSVNLKPFSYLFNGGIMYNYFQNIPREMLYKPDSIPAISNCICKLSYECHFRIYVVID